MFREPFNLRHIMLAYNLFQTIFNAWLVYKVRFTIVYKVRGKSTGYSTRWAVPPSLQSG